MSGYTPLFGSLTTGTLCGRWPDIGLWPIVLSLSDRRGVVDVTPAYIAGVTGLALPEVVACMSRFCEPDPYSRSPTDDGRRLTLLEPGRRDWGWRVVNHGHYREKARKASFDARRTESGEDADRKRRARVSVPTGPAKSREVPPSNTNTNTNTNRKKEEAGAGAPAVPVGTPAGLNHEAWTRWETYLRVEHARLLNDFSRPAAQRRLVSFGDEARQAATVEYCIANGWKTLNPLREDGPRGGRDAEPYQRKTADELEAEAIARGEDPNAFR